MKAIKEKQNVIYILILFALCFSFVGDAFLYSFDHMPRLERTLSNSFTPIMLLLSYYLEFDKFEITLICASILFFPHYYVIQKSSFENQHNAIIKIDEINDLRDNLSYNVFEIVPSNSEWENTIDRYGSSFFLKSFTLSLPAGAGGTSMSYYVLPYYAKYALVEKGVESENWLVSELPSVGYYLIYEDDLMYVYQNQIYGW